MLLKALRPILSSRQLLKLTSILVVLAALTTSPSLVRADVSRPMQAAGPTEVRVSMFILDVDDISSAKQNFEVNIYFELRWRDPRLTHDGPGEVVRGLNEIWHPRVKLANRQRIWPAAVFIEVAPDGEVVYRQRIWAEFSQPLDLEDFPFDRHTFEIPFMATGYEPDEVMLVLDPEHRSGIAEKVSVADWHISNWRAESFEYRPIPGETGFAGFRVTFDGERASYHYVIKVIIPLLLIVAMSWVAFWMDPSASGSQIGIATTAMLTLIAYRFAVGSELPNIPYLTRMDFFLLASTVLVFTSLLEVGLTSYLARTDRLELARRIDVWARVGFPTAFALVFVYAFV